MHDFLDGLKHGIEFFITLRPHLDIGAKLVATDGFANLVTILVLFGLGRLAYVRWEDSDFARNGPFGKVGFVIALGCLALAWSPLSVVCLSSFYAFGALTGFFIGVQNGFRLRSSRVLAFGIIIGVVGAGVLARTLTQPIFQLIQVVLLGWLAWDATSDAMSLIRTPEIDGLTVFMVVGGCISLSIFDPTSFNNLLAEVSKGTPLETKGSPTIATALSYSPLLGWVLGFLRVWPERQRNHWANGT